MSSVSRAVYRARQFRMSLRASIGESERAEAAALLGPELWRLFVSMAARDQRHCFDVYRRLSTGGCSDRDVLQAALLHDAGKGRLAGASVRLWHRVAYVLLAAAAPALLEHLSRGRGGLSSLHGHAERGAMLAEALGAVPAVVALVARHEEPDPADPRLALLRVADDSC